MKALPSVYLQHFEAKLPVEGELTVNPYYFILWNPSEIEKMNIEYEVPRYAPAYLGFASSGGGEMLAFDSDYQVFTIPFIGMSDEDALLVAKSWSEFLTYMKPEIA